MIISFFQKNLGNEFPILTNEQLQKLIQDNQKTISRLSRLKKIDGAKFTQDDELAELNIIQKTLLELGEIKDSQNIVNLILDCEKIDKALRLKEWSNYILPILSQESNPLYIISNIKPPSRPIEFAGLLLALLRNKVTPKAICHSGILHSYFYLYCVEIDLVTEVYNCLDLIPKEDPIYQNCRQLVELANNTSCIIKDKNMSLMGLENYSVSGSIKQPPALLFGSDKKFRNGYVFHNTKFKYIDEYGKRIRLNLPEDKKSFFMELNNLAKLLKPGEHILQLNNEQLESIISKTKYRPSFEQISVKKPDAISFTNLSNARNLYKIFGPEFIVILLTNKPKIHGIGYAVQKHELQVAKNLINELTLSQIKEIYQYCLNEIEDPRLQKFIIKKLATLLNKKIARELIETPYLTWAIIPFKLEILKSINKNDLEKYVKLPLTPKTFDYIINSIKALKKHSDFKTIEDSLFRSLLDAIINYNEQIKLEPKIVSLFKSYVNYKDLCESYLKEWRDQLIKTILENSFNYYLYLDIYKKYQSYKDKANILQELIGDSKLFPNSNYTLQFFILNTLYKRAAVLNIPAILESIHPVWRFNDYEDPEKEAKKSQLEILYGWMATLNDHKKLNIAITNIKNHYGINSWEDKTFDGKPILVLALENNNLALLQRYLYDNSSETDKEIKLKKIQSIDKILADKGFKSLWDYASINPFWADYLFPIYPQALLSKFLFKNLNNFEVFKKTLLQAPVEKRLDLLINFTQDGKLLSHHTILSFECFKFCYENLSLTDKSIFLNKTSRDKQNIFHLAALSLNERELREFLETIKQKTRYRELLTKDQKGNNFFTILATRDDINFYKIISNYFPENINEILQQEYQGKKVLQLLAVENSNQFINLPLKLYSQQIKNDLADYFHAFAETPKILDKVLQIYPLETQLEILGSQNLLGTSVFEVLCQNVNHMEKYFKLYNESILILAKIKNHQGNNLLHSLVSKPNILNNFLSFLSKKDTLELLSETNINNDTVLHLAARCNFKAFEIILNFLPREQLVKFLKMKNIHGKSVASIALDNFNLQNAEQQISNQDLISKILFAQQSKPEVEKFKEQLSFPKDSVIINANTFFQAWQKPIANYSQVLQSHLETTKTEDVDEFAKELMLKP